MFNYYQRTLARAARKHIISFLLYGTESSRKERVPPGQRIQEAEKAVLAFAAREFPGPDMQEKADELMNAMTETGEGHYEMGLMTGLRLSKTLRLDGGGRKNHHLQRRCPYYASSQKEKEKTNGNEDHQETP